VNRSCQALLISSTVALSWLSMMAVHELGHVLHGWMSGATVACVALPPLGFSRTDFAANPHPLLTAWGGGAWGCLLPLGLLAAVRLAARSYVYLAAWFAGFCLIANGAYLVGGAFLGGNADDAGVILQHGGARWQLLVFGIPAVIVGLYLWNGLGPHFGLGPAQGKVDRKAAVAVTAALVMLVAAEIVLGSR
jgi:hypothetical protein